MSRQPYLSVIVPVHKGAHVLPLSLGALEGSSLPRDRWELVVVDDASPDGSANVAAEYADTILRLPGRAHGTAYARNRGFDVARGDVAVFIDADVCVHPDTLSLFADAFAEHPDVGAAFGSYDDRPAAVGFISQYRNLLHHYHHQINPGDAETFWAGCGAVRADVFTAADKYDEWHFSRPQIEDIELGPRIIALGHRIVLRPEIQCTHLKRWTFRSMINADLRDRGVPWARLLVAQRSTLKANSLNLRTIEKISTALIWSMLLFLVGALGFRKPELLTAAFLCLSPVVLVNRQLYAFYERARGPWF